MLKTKTLTLKEYIVYRNKIVSRLRARVSHFGNPEKNYYFLRLKQLDELYPEFRQFGVINLK